MGKGSAQANINMGTFENERFPFPSVIEQSRIVAKLDSEFVMARIGFRRRLMLLFFLFALRLAVRNLSGCDPNLPEPRTYIGRRHDSK